MMTETEIDRAAEIAALGLTVDAVFVPFSRSRNKGEKSPSLNWTVTIKRNGHHVLTTDYSAGMGHCPAYKRKPPAAWNRPDRMWQPLACAVECEEGFALGIFTTWSGLRVDRKKPILPDPLSVLYSLTSDASVLDYRSYEDWGADLGFDPDSRKGEETYRACLEIALSLRAGVGESGMRKLAEIFQDY